MEKGDDMPDNRELYKKVLRENGLKVTTQRLAILEVLYSRPGRHMTAEEIYDLVKDDHPEIGLATVYRTIQLLSDLDLIDKLNLDDGYVRYEIGVRNQDSECHHHHHLICQDCGQIFAFQDDLLNDLEEKIEEATGFRVKDHEVIFYGHCKKCLNG
mgnify:FL=1